MAQGSTPDRVRFRSRPRSESGLAAIGGGLPAADAEKGRHREEDQPAQAAPHLRHQSAQRRGGTGGHQGPAGPREHRHHPDLHQRRAGKDGEGGGKVVGAMVASDSAQQEDQSDSRQKSL